MSAFCLLVSQFKHYKWCQQTLHISMMLLQKIHAFVVVKNIIFKKFKHMLSYSYLGVQNQPVFPWQTNILLVKVVLNMTLVKTIYQMVFPI